MLLPPHVKVKDGEYYPLWELIFNGERFSTRLLPPVTRSLVEFGDEITKNRTWDLKIYYFFWHIGFAGVVRRATNRSLEFWRHCENSEDVKLCETCRGWGYIRCETTEVWNGRPYKVTQRYQGNTQGIDWDNPAWCESCGGSGVED